MLFIAGVTDCCVRKQIVQFLIGLIYICKKFHMWHILMCDQFKGTFCAGLVDKDQLKREKRVNFQHKAGKDDIYISIVFSEKTS